MRERTVIELAVGKALPVLERDQVQVWFDDPHAALEVAAQLIRLASERMRGQGSGDVGITLLGRVAPSE